MDKNGFRRHIENLAATVGVRINGDLPWDIQVHDDRLYARVLAHGSLGLGESYMDGWFDCERLDEFFYRILKAKLDNSIHTRSILLYALKARLLNLQTPSRSYRSGQFHYDLGNDLYRYMLDKQMIYTAGQWDNASNLDEAQENKLESVCRKLQLRPGMKVLDVGCGWGGTARFMAKHYDVEVTGITVAREQAKLAKELCRGLPVEIRLEDYRSLNEPFDRILSMGMFEHVGYKNYSTFMRVAERCLKEDGLFLLRTIGGNEPSTYTDPWIARYIFPNGMLPSPGQIGAAFEGVLILEKWDNFGSDYDKTLMAWFKNFDENWVHISHKYGERFYRMWKYYLLSSAGSFRAGRNRLWEIILVPKGVPEGHHDIADLNLPWPAQRSALRSPPPLQPYHLISS